MYLLNLYFLYNYSLRLETGKTEGMTVHRLHRGWVNGGVCLGVPTEGTMHELLCQMYVCVCMHACVLMTLCVCV